MKLVLSLLALFCLAPSAMAELRLPVSYSRVFNDGKHLLVILAPKWASEKWDNNALSKTYPSSGLYLNDGSTKPLWTFPDYLEGPSFLSADGNSLLIFVSLNTPPSGAFYFQKGKLVRTYKPEDLTQPATILKPTCPPGWIWYRSVEAKAADVLLGVNDGRLWRFDLVSGRAVEGSDVDLVQAQPSQPEAIEPVVKDKPARGWFFALAGAFVLAGLALGVRTRYFQTTPY